MWKKNRKTKQNKTKNVCSQTADGVVSSSTMVVPVPMQIKPVARMSAAHPVFSFLFNHFFHPYYFHFLQNTQKKSWSIILMTSWLSSLIIIKYALTRSHTRQILYDNDTVRTANFRWIPQLPSSLPLLINRITTATDFHTWCLGASSWGISFHKLLKVWAWTYHGLIRAPSQRNRTF